MSLVTVEQMEHGVNVITLNDPDRRNILDLNMCNALQGAVERVQRDADATVAIFTGAGSAFCGGADMPAIFGTKDRAVSEIREDLRDVYASFLCIQDLRIPTISAVQGPAIGAGLNLALVCDIRIGGPDAQFGATFSRIGLHPGGGCTWFLTQALGPDRALKMLLDGGVQKGREAFESGLATHYADDPLAEAKQLAERYSQIGDVQLLRDIKTAVGIAASDTSMQKTLEFEAWAQASAATKPKVHEYLERFRK